MLRVGGEPRKTADPTLRGVAGSRTLPGGTKCVLRVGGEPRKTTTVNGTVPLQASARGMLGVSGALAVTCCSFIRASMIRPRPSSTTLAFTSRSLLTA